MVEAIGPLSREDFQAFFRAPGRPVVIRGMMEHWPARDRWDLAYLRSICQGEPIQVMARREADPRYEINADRHRTAMTFAHYVDAISHTEGNDLYMVAQNEFMHTATGQRLFPDIGPLPFCQPTPGSTFFWLGPRGTVTPLHHDTTDILYAQVHGRKRFTMIPRDQGYLLYNSVGVFSEVDCDAPDEASHPLYRYADKAVIELHAGELLFIPNGHWHQVRSLDRSISLSFTDFRAL